MDRCYVPHCGERPLVVTINGHDLILVGSSPDIFEEISLLSGHEQRACTKDSLSLRSLEQDPEKPENSDTKRSVRFPFFEAKGFDAKALEDEVQNQSSIRGVEVREYDLEALDPITRFGSDNNILERTIVGGDDGIPSVGRYEIYEKDSFVEMTRLEQFAKQLAAQSGSGVVFISAAISLDQLLEELKSQLSWCH